MGRIVGVLLICILVTACGGKKGGDIAKSEKDNEKASVNKPPVIESFKAVPQEGEAPLKVTFSWKVKDPDGDKITCSLDVNGDGAYEYKFDNCKENGSQEHTYKEPGEYNAVIKVVDNNNISEANINVVASIPNNNPTIFLFDAERMAGTKPFTAIFTWYTTDEDGDKLKCKLDADGNGIHDIIVEQCEGFITKSFTYKATGEYFAKLTVEDEKGGVTEDILKISVYPGWINVYTGPYVDIANRIKVTSDGGYILVGETNSYGVGTKDILLVKLDKDGYIQWQKTYGKVSYDEGVDVIELSDGGYLILGTTEDSYTGDFNILVLRVDDNGNIVWSKVYDSGGSESGIMFYKINNLMVGVLGVRNFEDILLFTIRTDNGDLVTSTLFASPDGFLYPHNILHSNGNITIVGTATLNERGIFYDIPFFIDLTIDGIIQNSKRMVDFLNYITLREAGIMEANGKTFIVCYIENKIVFIDKDDNNNIKVFKINIDGVSSQTIMRLNIDNEGKTIGGVYYNDSVSSVFFILKFDKQLNIEDRRAYKIVGVHRYGESDIKYIKEKGYVFTVVTMDNLGYKNILSAVIDRNEDVNVNDNYIALFQKVPIEVVEDNNISISPTSLFIESNSINLTVSNAYVGIDNAKLSIEKWAP